VCALSACTRQRYPANYHEYAYVSNGKSNSVSVVDVQTFKRLKDIAVGESPTGAAVNPVKREAYVVNSGSGSASVIDCERNEVVATIATGKSPYFIDVSADGKRGLVANSGDDTVSVIDLDARKVTATIHVGKSPGLVRGDEQMGVAIAAERNGNSISVIDLHSMRVRTLSMHVCDQPTDVVLLPSGTKAFVGCSGSNQVAVVGFGSGSSSNGAGKDALLTLLPVGKAPVHLAMKPDTGEIFVSNFDAGTISEIATGTNEVGGTYYIGKQPSQGLVSRDNTLLYISNFGSDNVAVYSVVNGKVIGTVDVGRRPDALALSQNGNFLLVADSASNDVAIVRTRVGADGRPTLFTFVPVGMQPNSIAIKSFLQ
jgi:YVTN family beta-propeller protein